MDTVMQRAVLTGEDGGKAHAMVPAFPDNPQLLVVPEGMLAWGLTTAHYFVPGDPAIGLGTTDLYYVEVSAYQPVPT